MSAAVSNVFFFFFDNPNKLIYENISSQCFKKFQDKSCVEIKFNKTATTVSTDDRLNEIDLFLDVELSMEEFSWLNLLLSILNIQSIFFGMTVLKLLKMFYSFIKPKLKRKLRNEKIAQFLIYLLCSFGFTWHTYRIFDMSIKGELTYSPNYEIAKQVRMPVMVFCLPIDKKLIDKNHRLTGNYLEKVTSDLTPEIVFKSIAYLNESSEWTPFNLVERFFFMHFKCFNITIDHEYDRRQFHFSPNSQVLKVLNVNFNKFISGTPIFFITKTKEIGFSNVVNLVYVFSKIGRSFDRYSAEQSELRVMYEDRFSFMKKLLSTAYEDDFNDLDGQLPEPKSNGFNFKTLKIPVKKHNFDFELQDDLFEQLFIRLKTETTLNLLNNLDYHQTFVFNKLKRIYTDPSFFTFSLSFIKRTLSAKNEENFAKLVLNLLNVLFLWYDLGILDLHPIFILSHDYLLVYLYRHIPFYMLEKITQFLLFSSKWLKKFKTPFYERLHARKRKANRIQTRPCRF